MSVCPDNSMKSNKMSQYTNPPPLAGKWHYATKYGANILLPKCQFQLQYTNLSLVAGNGHFVSKYGTIQIREICHSRYKGDENISLNHQKKWTKMTETLSSAVNNSDLSVDRMVARSSCQSSSFYGCLMSYGIAIYVIQNGRSSHLFSKIKLAPEPSKTLPFQ